MPPPTLEQFITQSFEGSAPTFTDLWDSENDTQVNWQIQLATELFLDSGVLATRYSVPVLERGLLNLIRDWELEDRLWDPDLPWPPREACIQSMLVLFRDVFAHLPLESSAFMWFDQLRPWGEQPDRRTHEILVATCGQVLCLPSARCRWAALHGLGHLPGRSKVQLIQHFLTRSDLPDDMREYARQAMENSVL